MPVTVQRDREIYLFGVKYPVAQGVRRELLNQITPTINVGDATGAPKEEKASKWNFTTTSGGFGRYRYHMGTGMAADKFFDASLRTDLGEVTLLPLATSVYDHVSTPTDILEWGSSVYVVGGTVIRRITSAGVAQGFCTTHTTWETLGSVHVEKALTAAAVSMSVFNGKLVIWETSTFDTYDGTSTWANNGQDGTYALTFDTNHISVDATGQISKTTDLSSFSNVAKIYDAIPTGMTVYQTGAGVPAIYIGTTKGLYIVDVANSTVQPTQVNFSDSNTDNCRGVAVWDGDLVFPKGGNVRRYVASNRVAQLTEFGPNVEDGLIATKVGRISDLETTMEHMMLAAMDAGAGTSGVYMWRGSAWHPLVVGSVANASIRCLCFTSAPTIPRLYYSQGTSIWYIPHWDTTSNPIQAPTAMTYRASGTLTTPWFGAAEIRNLAIDVRALARAYVSGSETITFEYALNDDDSDAAWTSLGSVIRNSMNSIGFANGAQGFRTIRLRVTLARGSDSTKTPRLPSGILRWTPTPKALYSFSAQLLLNAPYGGKSVSEMNDALVAAGNAGVGTFSYRTNDDRTVKLEQCRDMSQTGAQFQGQYQITVSELIPSDESDPPLRWDGTTDWSSSYVWV